MKIILIFLTLAVSGCATGRMVCEWQTEDEQIESIIHEVLKNATQKNEPTSE